MAGCGETFFSSFGRVESTFFRQILSSKSSRPGKGGKKGKTWKKLRPPKSLGFFFEKTMLMEKNSIYKKYHQLSQRSLSYLFLIAGQMD